MQYPTRSFFILFIALIPLFAIELPALSQDKKNELTFHIDPETFLLTVIHGGVKEHASRPLSPAKVTNLERSPTKTSWTYPEKQIAVSIENKGDYLDIDITSTGAGQFTWPVVEANNYTLPLWEGKYIPATDPHWKTFLKDNSFTFLEAFSMRFFALNKAQYAIVYIAKDMFNDEVKFDVDPRITFSFSHEFPTINKHRSYGFRLYVTANNPVAISGAYKKYIAEQGPIKTLEDKNKENPNISKLYGAAHFYLWPGTQLQQQNINWPLMLASIKKDNQLMPWVAQLMQRYATDEAKEFTTIIQQSKQQNYVDKYQKKIILRALNTVLALKQFYRPEVFMKLGADEATKLKKGVNALSEQELYTFNAALLAGKLNTIVDDPAKWGKDDVALLEDMKQSGIAKAWIGFSDWADALKNPALVTKANQLGYLVGPYDSYHSIHAPGAASWGTACFIDTTLYEQATVSNAHGKKLQGFLGKGRKLNPTLSMPSVEQRINGILTDQIPFNSWFVDCDATGEIYDDYSPAHITTQQADLEARLQRMDYINKNKKMVVGSEGGNDFASNTIAFAHGLETPVINWSDLDMRKNKNSEYYVGGYWANAGEIPAKYVKEVPIKSLYQHIYINPVYSLPLFRLVYNNVVITTHHWEWGSFKIKNEIGNRMLNELLYNTPPLYHINKQEWATKKQLIVQHLKSWSQLHEQAVKLPMTNFEILSPDRMVQSTIFGNKIRVVANFSDKDFQYQQQLIKAHSALIIDGEKITHVEVPRS